MIIKIEVVTKLIMLRYNKYYNIHINYNVKCILINNVQIIKCNDKICIIFMSCICVNYILVISIFDMNCIAFQY